MKRILQLQKLSKEHHLSLRLAKQCKDINVTDNDEALKTFCHNLNSEFNFLWKKHFKIEEESIFSIAETKDNTLFELCHKLRHDHTTLLDMLENITAGDYSLLYEFGQLLHDHTRLEERQLFPLIEKTFNPDELQNILNQCEQ